MKIAGLAAVFGGAGIPHHVGRTNLRQRRIIHVVAVEHGRGRRAQYGVRRCPGFSGSSVIGKPSDAAGPVPLRTSVPYAHRREQERSGR